MKYTRELIGRYLKCTQDDIWGIAGTKKGDIFQIVDNNWVNCITGPRANSTGWSWNLYGVVLMDKDYDPILGKIVRKDGLINIYDIY